MTAGIAVGDKPWKNDWKAAPEALYKKVVDHRLALTPFYYDAAQKSYRTGYPYMHTPLHLAYPDNEKVHQLPGQHGRFEWLINDTLLAAPKMYPENGQKHTMDVYFPEGTWIAYSTGNTYKGPGMVKNVPMPLGKAPAFVGGSGVVVERPDGHPKRPTWNENQEALAATFPARSVSGPGVDATDQLLACVYPNAPRDETFTFTWPDREHKSQIKKSHSGWNRANISVRDRTAGSRVEFQVDPLTRAVQFPIKKGHNYEITGGSGTDETPDAHRQVPLVHYSDDASTTEDESQAIRDLDFSTDRPLRTGVSNLSGANRFSQMMTVTLNDLSSDQVLSYDEQGVHQLWYDRTTDSISLTLRTADDRSIEITETGVSPATGQTVWIGWVFDRHAGAILYVNGQPVGSAEGTGEPLAEITGDHLLGGVDGRRIDGTIGSVKEWNLVISQSRFRSDP